MSDTYPFIRKEHCVYNNTFLQNTLVEVRFSSLKERDDQKGIIERFRDFVRKLWMLDLPDEFSFIERSINLFSEHKSVRIEFEHDRVKIIIGRDSYYSFEKTVLPYLKITGDFLRNVVKDDHILYFSLRKINIWPIQKYNNTLKDRLLKAIFSEELLSDGMFKYNSDTKNVTQWEKERVFNWEDFKIKLRYGFKEPENESYNELIVLDTVVEVSDNKLWDSLDFPHYNSILFDAYHWAVSPKIIEIMNMPNAK